MKKISRVKINSKLLVDTICSLVVVIVLLQACTKKNIDNNIIGQAQISDMPIAAVQCVNDTICIAVGGHYWSDAFVAVSKNAGFTWQQKTPTNLPAKQRLSCISVQDSNTIYIGGNSGMWLRTNAQCSNYKIFQHPSYYEVLSIVAYKHLQILLLNGISNSRLALCDTNGNVLQEVNIPVRTHHMMMNDNNEIFIAGDNGVYKTSCEASEIKPLEITNAQGDIFTHISILDNTIFVCGYTGTIALSTDGKHFKKNKIASTKHARTASMWQQGFIVANGDGDLIYVGKNGEYRFCQKQVMSQSIDALSRYKSKLYCADAKGKLVVVGL